MMSSRESSVEMIDDYNSDAMDSDIELELYCMIHHNPITADVQQNHTNHYESSVNQTSITNNFSYNNNNALNRTQPQPECIDISDDESDNQSIILLEDIDERPVNHNRNSSNKRVLSPDLMLSNVENLNDTTLNVMEKFYNEDAYDSEQEQQTINNMSDNQKLWKVNGNDLIFSNRRTNKRYYRNGIVCNNCSERGHISRDCREEKKRPVCYLCGNSGHSGRNGDRCVSKICSKCLSNKHNTNTCKTPSDQFKCEQCGQNGHLKSNCTYNWRKFHMTTNSESSDVSDSLPLNDNLKVNNIVCCYNCGAYGKHFGHECRSKSVTHYVYCYPPSPLMPLMPTTKKAHCFNDKRLRISSSVPTNKRNNGNIISSKQLSDGSRSVPSLTALSQRNHQTERKNKHIKWFYSETSATTPLSSKSKKCVIGKHIFDNSSPIFHNDIPVRHTRQSANTAHTPTNSAKIDNPMLANRQTLTTPKRSKRRRLASKQRRQLLRKTNENPNTTAILFNGRRNKIKVKRLRKVLNRVNKQMGTS